MSTLDFDRDRKESVSWLQEVGITVTDDNILKQEFPSFSIIIKLNKWTKRTESSIIKKRITQLKDQFLSERTLRPFLVVPDDAKHSALYILLENEMFQYPLVETLSQFIVFSNMDLITTKQITKDIMRDLSYHSKIYEHDKMSNSLLKCINDSSNELRPLLISYLPVILDCTDQVIDDLMDLATRYNELTKDVLISIESFSLSPEKKETIRMKVLNDILSSANINDIGTVTQFLVDTTDKNNAYSTIDAFQKYIFLTNDNLPYCNVILNFLTSIGFNVEYTSAYIKKLNDSLSFTIFDMWSLYCLFDPSSSRNDVQSLLCKKIDGGYITPNLINSSVDGFGYTLNIISKRLVDIILWMLGNSSPNVNDIGGFLAMTYFDECGHIGIEQDIISIIIQQVKIGNDENKHFAIKLLKKMCKSRTSKLSLHIRLIEDLLYSYKSLPFDIFKKSAFIIVALTFLDQSSIERNAGSQLHIFIQKVLNRSLHESVKYGVIVAAYILKRYSELSADHAFIGKHFNSVVDSISDNMFCTSLLFTELSKRESNNEAFNMMLFECLDQILKSILSPEEGLDTERYYVSNNVDFYVNFLDSVSSESGPRTHSLSVQRSQSRCKSSAYVMSISGLYLYLNCASKLNRDVSNVMKYPLNISSTSSDSTIKTRYLATLYLAHNWIMQLLNFFSKHGSEHIFDRLNHLVEIDESLYSLMMSGNSNVDEIIFIPQLPKFAPIVKMASASEYKSGTFMDSLREYFVAPTYSLVKIVCDIDTPFDVNTFNIVYRLLKWYLYLISDKGRKNDANIERHFRVKRLTNPPLDIIKYAINKLVPYLLDETSKKADELLRVVFETISAQLYLPCNKMEANFVMLLETLCQHKSRKKCIKYFQSLIKPYFSPHTTYSLLVIIKAILHSGPQNKYDKLGEEVKIINDISRKLLMSDDPILPQKLVKPTLCTFFDYNPNLVGDIYFFSHDLLFPEIYISNISSKWPSLNDKTSHIFFQQCFHAVNKKLREISSSIDKRNEILDENSIVLLASQLVDIVENCKTLLNTTAIDGIPDTVIKASLKCGVDFLNEMTNLMSFLKDAYDVDSEKVTQVINLVQIIRRNINSKSKFAKSSVKKLIDLVPRVSKAMQHYSCMVKKMLSTLPDSNVQVRPMQDRDLTGNPIPSSQ